MNKKSFLLFVVVGMITSLSHALCVKSDHVNLRAKPDATSKVTWVVDRYMPLVQIERKGAWVQVQDVDKSKHWVHARYVTNDIDCVVVKSKSAKLRLGPGSEYHLTALAAVRKYATFKKLGRDEAWLKLQDDYGEVHWAHEDVLWEPKSYRRVTF